MDRYEGIDQVEALLQKHGRVSYRSIKLQFALNEEQLETVNDELIEVRELAVDTPLVTLRRYSFCPSRQRRFRPRWLF
jgi:hypothetical protein